jgi:hypothetical protein
MSATTYLPAEHENPREHETEQPLSSNGNGASQTKLPVGPIAEYAGMDVERLKAAIKSAWNMQLRRAGKELGPLLYWLREKLRAQGSRNDLHNKDRGFGAWVEINLDVARSTAARWADDYAKENGLTSTQNGGSCPKPVPSKPVKPNKAITLRMNRPLREQYNRALDTIKAHFNVTDNGKAVVKGLCYAAKIINGQRRGKSRNERSTPGAR